MKRDTPVSQLTAGDIAYLLAWQANLIAEAIACEKDLDRNPFNEAREVEALFPPPPQPHRWRSSRLDRPIARSAVWTTQCSLCGAQVVNEDPVALNRQVAAEDAKGCPGHKLMGAP